MIENCRQEGALELKYRISQRCQRKNSVIISDGSEVQENEMDDVSLRKHKHKRMKMSSGNVYTCYDSEEYMENVHSARLCSRRVASTNELKRHAWDQREGTHQRGRRYGSARLHSMYLRSYPNSRSRSSKLDGLGSRNSYNTTKFKKHEMSDSDDRGRKNTRVQTIKIARPVYSSKEVGKCKASKYKQNRRVADYINRFKDTDTFSPHSASPYSGACVLYNSNLDSASHHSSQRRPDTVKEKYNKYSVSEYQKGRKRNVSRSEAIGTSTKNYRPDEAEERNSDILDKLSEPDVLFIRNSEPRKNPLHHSITSKTSSSKSRVQRMLEKKKGETDEHCSHHCTCPSFQHDLRSRQQTALQELRSSLNTSLKNSSLKVKAQEKLVQSRINRRKSAQERKRHLQELLRQHILTNRKVWLNKQSLSNQECGDTVQISSQNVSHISESASTSADCLKAVIASECNISLTSSQGVNVTKIRPNVENRTDVGKNDENADQNVKKCVSSRNMCSDENFFGSDLESDPNISVPCNLNSANDSRVEQIVNSSLASCSGSLVEKPLEDSVDRHNFSSVLGSTIINTPAVPALKVQCDPLVYRCDISPIKNSDSLITPIKNSRVNLLSSTLVCTKSNDVRSTTEANNDGPLGLQKESLNNLDFINYVSPLQKSTETANSLDCSAVNKPIKDVSSITTDTDLAAIANLLDHSGVNKSPNRDVTDTNLAAETNLLDSLAVSRSPNREFSGTISAAIANKDCDNSDSLLTPVVNYSTRIQTHLPVIPLRELNPAITKPTAALVNKKSLDHNRKSPVSKSSQSVNKNIFGSDLESLSSSDSEHERPLLARFPFSRNQSIGKSVEDSFDQEKTSLNSKPPDTDVLTKQPDKLCSKSEASEFTGAGTKEREKLGRNRHGPPPILTDEKACPLLDSSIAFPTVRRIAHQPKTYSASRKTRNLETSNVPNKSTQGSTLAVERLQQSDLLAPCPLPPEKATHSLYELYSLQSIAREGRKLNKFTPKAKQIAEYLCMSAVSAEADARDSNGKRLYISSIVSPAESANVVNSDVKGTPAVNRRAAVKRKKMKTETQASREGTITQVEINKSNIGKEVDADKDKLEKDHCIKAARGHRCGRKKNINPCSKSPTPTNEIELTDLSSKPDDSAWKEEDNSSISPPSPEIPPCQSPVQKPSVIPASPMKQCDGGSQAVVSPPCVHWTQQQNYSLARQRTSGEIRAGEKKSVRSVLCAYLAVPFKTGALSHAVQKLVTVSNVKIVAKCVIKYAANAKSKVVPDPPAPPLSNRLKRLFTLILKLQQQGPQWQILTEYVLQGIEYKLFHLGHSIKMVQARSLTLLYTSLCRIIPDRFRVQSFCLMALYSKYRAHALIYSALTVVPEALPKADVGEKIPLVQCLVYLVLHHSPDCNNASSKVTALKTMLKEEFGYKSEVEPPEIFLHSLINELKRGCPEASLAIILLAKQKGWQWTKQFIIDEELQPILREWKQGTVSEQVATEAFQLIGKL